MAIDTPRTLIDSNVLLDVLTDDENWADWSTRALSEALDRGAAVISPIIYTEVSVGFERIEDVDAALPRSLFVREELPWAAGFLAGKAFLAYRRRGGEKRSPLPDFYIGAHAAVSGSRLLTRDASRYRTYFPQLRLVHPG
ncbi:type II toxin-antitoxin system VapC family toxin [Brevibacterium album]|uniref:type II toxin-antitoxin system VapC family toxin n=1 Tax=Brevibacterium album TaxID=417948 RepID=UPI000417219B|nr:type II toxin-antitoxin system VapC family toxin [Brevibacterium album]